MITRHIGAMKLSTPSELEIELSRTFDAPRRLVFEAITRPEHVRRWWGPRAYTMTVCDIDFRVGGAWRYEQQTPEGAVAFKGEYQEIVAPERIVHTEIFDAEGFADEVSTVTVVLTEENGRTTMVTRQRFPTVETRDMVLSSGMESGAAESWDRLAELLATSF